MKKYHKNFSLLTLLILSLPLSINSGHGKGSGQLGGAGLGAGPNVNGSAGSNKSFNCHSFTTSILFLLSITAWVVALIAHHKCEQYEHNCIDPTNPTKPNDCIEKCNMAWQILPWIIAATTTVAFGILCYPTCKKKKPDSNYIEPPSQLPSEAVMPVTPASPLNKKKQPTNITIDIDTEYSLN